MNRRRLLANVPVLPNDDVRQKRLDTIVETAD